MRLERALITGSASPALSHVSRQPHPHRRLRRPCGEGERRWQARRPNGSTETLVDEVSCSLGRCCGDSASKEPRHNCRRTVSEHEHGQSVKPSSPIRSVPVKHGRARPLSGKARGARHGAAERGWQFCFTIACLTSPRDVVSR